MQPANAKKTTSPEFDSVLDAIEPPHSPLSDFMIDSLQFGSRNGQIWPLGV
jgi:hypothetical protein